MVVNWTLLVKCNCFRCFAWMNAGVTDMNSGGTDMNAGGTDMNTGGTDSLLHSQRL